MAEERWTVIATTGRAGSAREGYVWEKMKTVKGTKNKSWGGPVSESGGAGNPVSAVVYVVEAESEEEAAEAVQKAYGQGNVTGKFIVAKTSNTKEVAPQ